MNAKLVVVSFFILSFLFQSCIPSLHPLYTEDKLVFIEDLLGIWTDEAMLEAEKKLQITFAEDGSNMPRMWSFEKGSGKSYHLIHVEDSLAAAFDVHVIQLGEHYFLDFYRVDASKEEADKYHFPMDVKVNTLEAFHLLPVHTFAKMEITDEHLAIKMFDAEFIEDLFEEKRIRLKHEIVDQQVVLTAGPEELQKFVSTYADHPDAFLEGDYLKRKF